MSVNIYQNEELLRLAGQAVVSDTVDSSPTSGSTNLVTSGGVADALDGKLATDGDSKSNTVTFTSSDTTSVTKATGWTTMSTALTSGSAMSTLFGLVSKAIKNVRWLYAYLIGNIMPYTSYSTSTAYSVGDVVTYQNTCYICTTACSAGTWATNSSCFTKSTLLAAHNELNANLTSLSTLVSGVEEQVGTLDGVPLYRKIYKADGTWTTDTTLDSTLKTTNIRIYKINESYNVGGSVWVPPLDYYTTDTGRQYVFIGLTTRLYIQIGGLTIKGYNVEIFYTKIS